MTRDLDIAQLRTFLVVAEHGNITHAATLRNLTQSAISQQIKRLEETIGCALLTRSSEGVSLTSAGGLLLPDAKKLVRSNDQILSNLAGIEVQKEIRLGVPQDIVCSLLPAALSTFHQAEPDVHVTLVSQSSRILRQMQREGQVDLILTTDLRACSNAVLLLQSNLAWIGAAGGQAYKKSPLPVAVGAQECPFRQAASRALAKDRIAWRPVTQVGSLEPVFATLLADLAVAPFLPGTFPHGTSSIRCSTLPKLPAFRLHLRKPSRALNAKESSLCEAISEYVGQR